MFTNYLKSASRYFFRHKFFSFLNILALSIGFAATMLLSLFVWQETSYDNFHEMRDRIVRVTMEYKVDGQVEQVAQTGALVAQALSEDLPEVEKAVRFAKFPTVVKHEDYISEEENFLYADSTLFDVFSFELQEGNPREALQGPYKVVLTQEAASRYFGEEDPVGSSLLINDRPYAVTGIIKEAPENSQIKYDFIASFASLSAYRNPVWFNANYFTYLLLQSPESIKPLSEKIMDYMKSQETRMEGENYLTYNFEPLQDVHVYSKHSGLEPNIDTRYIYIFSIVAILVLFISCINYMNLATARAADRGVDVGIRKVMGAQKHQLFWQYISEAFINVVIAFLAAWLLASVTLPFFNFMLDRNYTMNLFMEWNVILIIASLLVLITIGAGAYPSVILSGFKPLKTLKGAFKTSHTGLILRRTLIIFQFAVSATLIICSLVIYKQLAFVKNKNLGYQKEHVIAQSIDEEVVNKIDVLRGYFDQLPQVEEVTMAYETPTSIGWSDGISINEEYSVITNAAPVEVNYLNTLKIELLAGEDFSVHDQNKANSDSASYLHQQERSIIINESAANALGWTAEEAVGRKANFKGNAIIKGVIKDFHFAPMHEEIGPLVLFVDNMYNTMMIRIKGDDVAGALETLSAKWKEAVPHIPFDPQFIDEEYDAMYTSEQQLGKLALFFTAMTVILGCLGLLGLSALLISHRLKEIGIRKVMGASTIQIINVLSKDFIKQVIIAFILAIPISWYAMDKWLQGFSYRIDMPYLIFPVAGIILVILSLITISSQTFNAALRNPAEVLKSE